MENNISNPETPKIAVIGGGTGSSSILYGVKYLTPEVTGIINMCDDGNSSGKLQQKYGVHSPGDVRQSLAALTPDAALSQLINERLTGGEHDGHARGNLLLASLELRLGSFEAAVDVASKLFGITGSVLPVTLDRHELAMSDGNEVIRGESRIDKRQHIYKDRIIWLDPAARLNPKAEAAIHAADVITIAYGSIDTSIRSCLAVHGMKEALRDTKAQIVVATNLLNQPRQTNGWHVADYIRAIENHLVEDTIDLVLYNTDLPSRKLIDAFGNSGETPVDIEPKRFKEISARAVGTALLSKIVSITSSSAQPGRKTTPHLAYDPHIVAKHLVSFVTKKSDRH